MGCKFYCQKDVLCISSFFTNYNDDITTILNYLRVPCSFNLTALNCFYFPLFSISRRKVQMAEIGASEEEAWIDNILCDSSISNNNKMD